MQTIKKLAPPFAVLIALITAFWAPTLFNGKSLIHGDSILHGLSLWEYHARNAYDFDNLLWSKEIYGGHPLFAESQGGFAYPLHMLLARTMEPIYANNFAHWIGMLIGSVGLFGLSRTVGNSNWASGFATLATLFASYWLHAQQNMTYGAAVTWLPWVLWAGEYWILRPGWRSAFFLGITTALAVLVGYPHLLHGAALYVGVSLLSNLMERKSRAELFSNFSMVWKTGLLAVLISVGLAAVQWLPLLELTNYSHRASGTAITLINLPLSIYLRGLLYNLHTSGFESPDFFTLIGSILICLLFSIFVFFKIPPRIKGHIIATLLLFNLGIGGSSPVFRVLYDHNLIPGMHYFRFMAPYLIVAIVGISLIAANSIDNLTIALTGKNKSWRMAKLHWSWRQGVAALVFLLFWFFMFRIAGFDIPVGSKHMAIVALGVLGVAALTRIDKAVHIPMFLFLLLATEAATMKLHEFHFGDIKLLEKPQTAQVIERDDPSKNYKFYDSSLAFLYAMGSPSRPSLDQDVKQMLMHLCGLSPIRWNIPSMMGALALPLREVLVAEPIILSEINAKSTTPAGLRLIDLLSVKYIGFESPVYAPGFRLKYHDSTTSTWLIENTAAKPRFQIYTNYVFANSSQEALAALQSTAAPLLALETPSFIIPHASFAADAFPITSAEPHIEFTLTEDRATHYQLRVNAMQPGWLFLADANYPGWHAYIDGGEVPVFTAQILGKAIYIPTGTHKVILAFKSNSFRLGLLLTLFTLFSLALISIFIIARRYRTRPK